MTTGKRQALEVQQALFDEAVLLVEECRFAEAIYLLEQVVDLGGPLGIQAERYMAFLTRTASEEPREPRLEFDMWQYVGGPGHIGGAKAKARPKSGARKKKGGGGGGRVVRPRRGPTKNGGGGRRAYAGPRPGSKKMGRGGGRRATGPARTSGKDRVLRGERRGLARLAPELRPGTEVRRTPHMDIIPEPPLQPGDHFEVLVYADAGPARPGEEAEPIVLEFPPGVDTLRVSANLVPTDHFVIEGNAIQQLAIERDEPRSTSAGFQLHVRDADELTKITAAPSVTVYFTHAGRGSGLVRRLVRVAKFKAHTSPPRVASYKDAKVKPVLAINAVAAQPDLTIEILDPANDSQHLTCTVFSPHLDGFRDGKSGRWDLRLVTDQLVTEYFDQFTAEPPSARQTMFRLRGAGLELFDSAPEVFKEAFWALVDQQRPLRTIYVNTQEPSIPWELMIPNRGVAGAPREEWDHPLGVEFSVGRWIKENFVSPKPRIPLSDGVAIAPNYRGTKKLQHAAAEIAFLDERFAVERFTPATIDGIEAGFARGGASFLHFACHGSSEGQEGSMEILLDGGKETLDSQTLRGMRAATKACGTKNPLVFMNACEVGRQKIALNSVGGLAPTFARIGASAVLAPLWSVKDTIAFEVAKAFYEASKRSPETPFAEIVRGLRLKSYQDPWEDSWAAYCFYGDPLATQAGV